uniref:Multidrug efflux pump subunit AcrA (Membrane-fusion protein) n=1 Tax=Candidatus Kentrum eta TaxID=2126337 RepID=A0A450V5F9_9GAMM|nr:MAG: Multidrug efflux pump subunit AcrA (membrane-fusion protein) [Candidatus Kentron sp. H]VFK00092.1 MAG: Multidrug efflux pump subunit AcrA (membrane-fusion protein) [Candidatus Kentron sp. H]VFK04397.1 MAG: Multidrug efflux pump subunit AcrA (membrane-fusion protein) [Candidatus Kentron sp. H]
MAMAMAIATWHVATIPLLAPEPGCPGLKFAVGVLFAPKGLFGQSDKVEVNARLFREPSIEDETPRPMTAAKNSTLMPAVSALFQLQERTWAAKTPQELAFIAVNETHMLAPYRQAVLWIQGQGVVAVSGIPVPEKDAPFIQWVRRLAARLVAEEGELTRPISPRDLVREEAEEWRNWLPESGLILFLATPSHNDAKRFGLLLMARDGAWPPATVWLLGHLAGTYSHAWGSLAGTGQSALAGLLSKGPWKGLSKRWLLGILILVVTALAFLPVPLTVLAPAEIVPVSPIVIRSPLEGVVDRIRVRPDQKVTKDSPLFDLDRTTLDSRLEVAQKTLQTVEAEYRQTAQQAMVEQRSKARLAILKGKADEHRAEIAHLRALIARSRVTAPRDGIILLDDPTEWIGRPVVVGERVMMLADEFDAEVEAWVSIGDAIALAPGAPVTVFLNADPLHAVRARLRTFSYEAAPRPDGSFAHRVRATLAETEGRRRIGLRGTARLTGRRVALVYWIFRRPWAAIRRTLGV